MSIQQQIATPINQSKQLPGFAKLALSVWGLAVLGGTGTLLQQLQHTPNGTPVPL